MNTYLGIPGHFKLAFFLVQDGDVSKSVSITSGLDHGVEIPAEGLERHWFRLKYELQTTNILPIHDYDRIEQGEIR